MPAPSIYITINDAVALIREIEETDVARTTVYGWTKAGRRGVILRTKTRAGKLYTRTNWVKDFLDAIR
jgi:hypothetical protein